MNSFYFWDEMATKCLKSEHLQEAIQAYKHALESTDDNADQASVWANIGKTYLTLQDVPSAVDAFLTASRLDPVSYDFDCLLERITENGYLNESAMIMAKDMYAVESVKTSLQGEGGIDQFPMDVLVADDEGAFAVDTASTAPVADVVVTENLAGQAAAELPDTISEPVVVETVSTEETDQPVANAAPSEVTTEVEVAEATSAAETPEIAVDTAVQESVAKETNPETQAVIETAEPAIAAETSPVAADVIEAEPTSEPESPQAYIMIPVAEILGNPLHLRASMQSEDLVESVRQHGILQPLVVTQMESGKYMVVTGNRRLEAARLAALEHVPAVVRSATEREFLELALIENIQRVNLDPLELAEAYQLLVENFGMSVDLIASSIGKSCSVVAAALDLLNLTEEGKQALQEKSISEGHARALVAIELPALQNNALVYVLENRLGVRQTEDLVRIILNAVAVSRSYDESYREEATTELQQEPEPAESTDEAAIETPELNSAAETELPSAETDTILDVAVEPEIVQTVADAPAANPEPDIIVAASTVETETTQAVVSIADQPIVLEVADEAVVDLPVAEFEVDEAVVEKIPAENKVEQTASDAVLENEAIDFYWIKPEAEAENHVQPDGIPLPASAEFSVEETLEEAASSASIPVESISTAVNSDATRDMAVEAEVVVADSALSPVIEAALQKTEENLEDVIEEIVQFTAVSDVPLGEPPAEAYAAQTSVNPEPVTVLDGFETSAQNEPNETESRTQLKGLEAIAVYRRVVENNPANVRIWHLLGNLHSSMGQYEEAIDCLKRTVELDPDKYTYYYHLGLTLAIARHYPEAIQALEKTIELAPQHILAHCSLAGCYRRVGNETEAQKHIEIAKPKLMQEKAYNRACFESISGNRDQAIELLQIALNTDKTPVEWLLRDPDLDFIRDDPRFQAMLADLNIPVKEA